MNTGLSMEKFKPDKHDSQLVATLIYTVDPELNEMVYGSQTAGIAVIKKLLQLDGSYFSYPYLTCAVCNGEVAGVLLGFEGKEKQGVEKASAKAFVRAFGLWSFLKKLPTLMRMGRLTWKAIDDDGYFVSVLCVAPSRRGQGVGASLIKSVSAKYNKVYLDVNIKNARAQKFYAGLGFQMQGKNTLTYKGKIVGTYSLKKEESAQI
ncbi:MAG: putative N-acetyltransferase [Syntrophomonadaceae bacterium]|nr:putative N-acetyltransferase [Bacillota bacterium]